MFEKIREWWHWYMLEFLFWVILLIILMLGVVCMTIMKNAPPRTERIQVLATGKLISIRATGSFSIYEIELKFEDGSMILVTYSFSRRNDLKVGRSYEIWKSSNGYRCKLLNH